MVEVETEASVDLGKFLHIYPLLKEEVQKAKKYWAALMYYENHTWTGEDTKDNLNLLHIFGTFKEDKGLFGGDRGNTAFASSEVLPVSELINLGRVRTSIM